MTVVEAARLVSEEVQPYRFRVQRDELRSGVVIDGADLIHLGYLVAMSVEDLLADDWCIRGRG